MVSFIDVFCQKWKCGMVFHAFSFVFSQFPLALETKSISVTSPRNLHHITPQLDANHTLTWRRLRGDFIQVLSIFLIFLGAFGFFLYIYAVNLYNQKHCGHMNKDILQERRLTFSVFRTVAMRVILQRRKRGMLPWVSMQWAIKHDTMKVISTKPYIHLSNWYKWFYTKDLSALRYG